MNETLSMEQLTSMKIKELRKKAESLGIDLPFGITKERLISLIVEKIDTSDTKEILTADVTPVFVDPSESKPSQIEKIKGAEEELITVRIRRSIPRSKIGPKWYEVQVPKNTSFVERRVPRAVAESWEQAGYL